MLNFIEKISLKAEPISAIDLPKDRCSNIVSGIYRIHIGFLKKLRTSEVSKNQR